MDANLMKIVLIKASKDSDKKNLELSAFGTCSDGEPQVFFANITRSLDGEKIDSKVSHSRYTSAQSASDVTIFKIEKNLTAAPIKKFVNKTPQAFLPLKCYTNFEKRNRAFELVNDFLGFRNGPDIQCNNQLLCGIG